MKGARIPYSAVEMAWLVANRSLVISDYFEAFQAAFSRPDVSQANLHSLRKRKGWKVGRTKGRTAGRSWLFNKAELEWLSANATLPIADYHRAFCTEFGRTDVSAQNLNGLRKRRGWRTGRTGRFAKGAVSHNKGKRCPEGVGGRSAASRRTQFRKGQLPHNTKHLGYEHVRTDGFVEISIDETNPHTGYERRMAIKHVYLWEKANGPVPEGHCLKCLDGDKTNCDPSNWELIPRGVLPRINGSRATRGLAYDEASPEVRPTLLAIARLDHRVREVRRQSAKGQGQ